MVYNLHLYKAICQLPVLSWEPNFWPCTAASIVSIVQHIVYFKQNVNDQALWGWERKKKNKTKQNKNKNVLLTEKDYFELFPPEMQRYEERKNKNKTKTIHHQDLNPRL